jgi:hypothetical protein
MGRMRASSPRAIAQVTTTAQFGQCLARVEACDLEGQMCVLKASVRSATDEAALVAVRPGHCATPRQFPSASSSAVLAEVLSRITSTSMPEKAGESATSAEFRTNGMPTLADHLARLPCPAPSARVTEARKAMWAGSGRFTRRGCMTADTRRVARWGNEGSVGEATSALVAIGPAGSWAQRRSYDWRGCRVR